MPVVILKLRFFLDGETARVAVFNPLTDTLTWFVPVTSLWEGKIRALELNSVLSSLNVKIKHSM